LNDQEDDDNEVKDHDDDNKVKDHDNDNEVANAEQSPSKIINYQEDSDNEVKSGKQIAVEQKLQRFGQEHVLAHLD
jgi:hypothetical protein